MTKVIDRHNLRRYLTESQHESPRSVATAARVERDAPQEVGDAVTAGAMSFHLAAQVAELPAEEQDVLQL